MMRTVLCKRQPAADTPKRWITPSIGLLVLLAGFILPAPARAQIDIVEEIDCLALNIYFEARGESDLGKIAVGHVVLNRVADTRFPETVCAVVRQGGEKTLHRCQFSWWCDGRSDSPRDSQAWGQVKAVARKVYWGFSPDPTDGSLWYHAAHVSPSWGKALTRGPKIGQHLFYSDDTIAPRWQASFAVD